MNYEACDVSHEMSITAGGLKVAFAQTHKHMRESKDELSRGQCLKKKDEKALGYVI